MKKEYNTPEIEVTKFDVEDVITTSVGGGLSQNGPVSASYGGLTWSN